MWAGDLERGSSSSTSPVRLLSWPSDPARPRRAGETAPAPRSIARDRAGDAVLGEMGEAEVGDAAHQDREGHDAAAGVEAVAGEIADAADRAGLGAAAAISGGA